MFVDPKRLARLACEVYGGACGTSDAEREPPEEDSSKEPFDSPNILRRHVVASRREVKLFGPHLASEAWRLGFMHAEKGAFAGDGSETILQLAADHLSDDFAGKTPRLIQLFRKIVGVA